jgi:gluconate 2-dehydrogenase alpha chain
VGREWKKATGQVVPARDECRRDASNMPNRYNAYDLDPTYKNVFGQPLLRLTYNFLENDKKVIAYVGQKAAEIARSLKPTSMTVPARSASTTSSHISRRTTPAARSWARRRATVR